LTVGGGNGSVQPVNRVVTHGHGVLALSPVGVLASWGV